MEISPHLSYIVLFVQASLIELWPGIFGLPVIPVLRSVSMHEAIPVKDSIQVNQKPLLVPLCWFANGSMPLLYYSQTKNDQCEKNSNNW